MLLKRTSISGRAALDRKTIHHADIVPLLDTEYPDARDNAQLSGFRAVLAVPLMRDGGAYGAIFLWRREPRLFAPDQVALVETFARQAAIAIDNVRLFNETKEALEQQTAISEVLRVISESPTDVTPVFEAILESATRLFDSPLAAAFRYDGQLVHLVATHNWSPEALEDARRLYPAPPNPQMISGRVIQTRTVQIEEDTLLDPAYDQTHAATGGWRRLLGAPMLKDGAPVGVIVVAWPNPGKTPQRQADLLKTFADQAVIAIENVRLISETKEALEQQTAISEILRVISSSPGDVRPMLHAVAERALALCDAAQSTILLVEGDSLRVTTSLGSTPPLSEGEFMPLTRGSISGRAVVDRTEIHLPDLAAQSEEEYPIGREMQRRIGHRAVLSVPLMREDRAIGVIGALADGSAGIHRQADRAGANLRRPGGHRDRERAAVQ